MNFSDSIKRLSLEVVVATFCITGPTSSQEKVPSPADKPAQGPAPSPYVGADTCKTCHEDTFNNLQQTRHWNSLLKTKDGAEAHSCETCHGPGAEHVNSGGDKSKVFTFEEATPKDITKRCLECHSSGADHMNFSRSALVLMEA
jgi:hypothetical protein